MNTVYEYLFEALLSILLIIYPQVELLDHMVNSISDFLRNHRALSLSSHTTSRCPQQCTRAWISPHSCQHLLFSVFLIVATIMGMRL